MMMLAPDEEPSVIVDLQLAIDVQVEDKESAVPHTSQGYLLYDIAKVY